MQHAKTRPLGLALVLLALLALVAGATAAGSRAHDRSAAAGDDRYLVSESALLAGLASNALFPFLDTTPNRISSTHIAVTDATANCAAGAAPPASIQVLVGQAGVALTNVMTAATNTGIGTPAQCVFHVTARPGRGGVPETVTDVVVRNASGAPLTGINTVTASASVGKAR